MSGLLQAVKFIRHPKFAHHGQSEFFVLIQQLEEASLDASTQTGHQYNVCKIIYGFSQTTAMCESLDSKWAVGFEDKVQPSRVVGGSPLPRPEPCTRRASPEANFGSTTWGGEKTRNECGLAYHYTRLCWC